MTRTHEKLLVAALAGMIIAGAAAFVIQPVFATGKQVVASRATSPLPADGLNLRLYSPPAFLPGRSADPMHDDTTT